jgi:hypothetical protein
MRLRGAFSGKVLADRFKGLMVAVSFQGFCLTRNSDNVDPMGKMFWDLALYVISSSVRITVKVDEEDDPPLRIPGQALAIIAHSLIKLSPPAAAGPKDLQGVTNVHFLFKPIRQLSGRVILGNDD